MPFMINYCIRTKFKKYRKVKNEAEKSGQKLKTCSEKKNAKALARFGLECTENRKNL